MVIGIVVDLRTIHTIVGRAKLGIVASLPTLPMNSSTP